LSREIEGGIIFFVAAELPVSEIFYNLGADLGGSIQQGFVVNALKHADIAKNKSFLGARVLLRKSPFKPPGVARDHFTSGLLLASR